MVDRSVPPEVTVRGADDPEVVVVGGVHGDETGGVRAVRRLREADLDLQRGVAFVLANPPAIEAGERFLESDLNRRFPGDPDGDLEERLAARVCSLVGDRPTLSLHDTHSRPTPFALVHRSQPQEFDLATKLPVGQVVDHWGVNENTITTCGLTVEIEVGPQGTDEAAVSAERQARAFLERVDALPDDPPGADPVYFHMAEAIPKPPGETYEVYAENFQRVEAGEVYASVDGRDLVADEPFYPVLMSPYGSPSVLGYRGYRIAESLEGVYEAGIGAERD